MKEIQYVRGDATTPIGNDKRIIVHICNDIGGWGKGFVMALSKKWKTPEKQYREWFKSKDNFELGEVQFIAVEENIWVANMIAQHKINRDEKGEALIRYESVKKALAKVSDFARNEQASVHMPRIGCGLAGGKWECIEPIILETLSEKDVEVTVYDF